MGTTELTTKTWRKKNKQTNATDSDSLRMILSVSFNKGVRESANVHTADTQVSRGFDIHVSLTMLMQETTNAEHKVLINWYCCI